MSEGGIRDFFRGKSIFITGGSGFMGKVLIEKILYSCSDITEIFLLMRPKRGKSGEQRVAEFANVPVFHRIKDQPELFKKIKPVYGDIVSERLGLSDEHYNLVTATTNVVFHMAASLKLEATLKPNVEMNLAGTKHVLDMCKDMKNLLAALHLSTAFSNCDQEVMHEEVYDWPQKPLEFIRSAKWMSEEAMHVMGQNMMSAKLNGKTVTHPNTYTFTKRLSEILVRDEYDEGKLNVCIVRPAIVTPAWKQPIPGWVDSLNGPIGIMVAGGKGVLRSMICEETFTAQVIPVDQAISGLLGIAMTMGTMKKRAPKIPVFNVVCSEKKKITWGTVLNEGKRINYLYPFEAGLWYPNGNITMNPVRHYLTLALTMWLPALLIDFLMLIFFQPRFMIRVQKKIFVGLHVLQFFTTREWNFTSDNFKRVYNSLSAEEKEIFHMNTEDVEEIDYLKDCMLGGRQYCLKEPPSSIPKARIAIKIQYIANLLLQIFFVYMVGKWVINWTGLSETITEIISRHHGNNSL